MHIGFPQDLRLGAEDFPKALLALIDLADSVLKCTKLIVSIDNGSEDVSSLVHALVYVGFDILFDQGDGKVMLEYEV